MNTTQRVAVEGPGGLCTKEIRTFEVEAYRDSNGAPTCCVSWDNAMCRFLVTRKFGLVDVCSATGVDVERELAESPPNKRRESYNLLRPVEGCPVWGK